MLTKRPNATAKAFAQVVLGRGGEMGMANLAADVGMGWPAVAAFAPLVARVMVGALFLLSGFYKLFAAKSAEKMRQTMVDAGIVAPRQTARSSAVCEFVFGALLLLGVLTSLAALVLLVIWLVALCDGDVADEVGRRNKLRLSAVQLSGYCRRPC